MRTVHALIAGTAVAALLAATDLRAQNPSPAPPQGVAKSQASSYDPALLQSATLTEHAPATFAVKVTTTRGSFIVTVTRAWAPLGADRFYNLVKHHFYNGASFFRVIQGFVAQFGISPYPAVTTAWEKSFIADDPVKHSNTRGSVVFATSGPNTRTTQLFINLVDNARLDPRGFAPFGHVTQGMAVVDSLYHGYGEGGMPGGGPDQEQMEKQGKPYIDKGWPKLDTIIRASLYTPPAAPASTKTTAPAPKP